jgi:hypothetical protein
MQTSRLALGLTILTTAALTACGGGDGGAIVIPQLSEARSGTLSACTGLLTNFGFANTSITAASDVAAGTLSVGGNAIPAHCLVTGNMFSRTGTNGSYAIGFQMRMPTNWNGRYYYQGNGGLDGSVSAATGQTGGGPVTGALYQGFAVISSDAGHTGAQTTLFGFEPQARLDYGYQAAQKLTPMAKALIRAAYGRAPDRSYFGGCSNGGRHTLVATSRLAEEYDGYLAGAPGYNLPKAAVAQIWGAQQWATAYTAGTTIVSNGRTLPDLSTAFTSSERSLVSKRILAKCDALDQASDGIVSDTAACQRAFSVADDVPTCTGARDGTCLTSQQKQILTSVHAGAKTTAGASIYNSFSYDPGISGAGWASWKFVNSLALDPLAVGTVFGTPPAYMADPLTASVDSLFAGITTVNSTYTESGMSFMTPPNPADLSKVKNRGAKVMVYHGVSDPVFSYDDSVTWYKNLATANGGDASNFARLYGVPGMNHCSGGFATDQFDMLSTLVNWVEKGQSPDSVIAKARGTGNPGGVNTEVPGDWSVSRTRPLCPYPKVAKYKGSGSLEDASNFSCQ